MFLNQHRLDYWIKTHTGTAFSPTSLFANSETGGWWDPADHATTFQDTSGTIPANTAGQNVQRINDKSGNGNNLVLGGALSPILRNSGLLWWIEFRGLTNATDSNLNASFTLVQPHTRINALANITWNDSTAALFDGFVHNTAKLVGFTTTPNITMFAGAVGPQSTDLTINVNHVCSEFYNGGSSTLTIDNGTAATGNPGPNNPGGIYVASNDTPQPSDINWFGGINIGRVLTAPETANCRTFFGALAGLSL